MHQYGVNCTKWQHYTVHYFEKRLLYKKSFFRDKQNLHTNERTYYISKNSGSLPQLMKANVMTRFVHTPSLALFRAKTLSRTAGSDAQRFTARYVWSLGWIAKMVGTMLLLAATANGPVAYAATKLPGNMKKIVFCSDLTNPPGHYTEQDGSTPAGVAVDMLNALGKELTVPVEILNLKLAGIFAALDTGKCDAVMSSLSKTPERAQKYNFVDYWAVASGLLVKKGNPGNLRAYTDLSGKRVAVLLGSANHRRLDAINEEFTKAGKPKIDIAAFGANTVAFHDLDLGRVDAMVSDTLTLSFFLNRSNGKFEIGGTPVPPATLGMVTAKSATDLAAALRTALDNINASGEFPQLIKKWGVGEGVILCSTAKPCP